MPTAQKKVVVFDKDFFDGLFCGLVLKGVICIAPDDQTTIEGYAFRFDAACIECFKAFEKYREELGISSAVCLFPSVMTGTCEEARDHLLWMMQNGQGHICSPYDGVVYLDTSAERAERILRTVCEKTNIDYDFWLSLADLFLETYRK